MSSGCAAHPAIIDVQILHNTSNMNKTLSEIVDLQGHRGARGKRPENTIPAFQYCIENHMTTIELDTNLTKDRQLIIYHDTALNGKICRSENGNPAQPIPIKNLTVEELKQYDCGAVANHEFPEQIPSKGTRLITLVEFFDFIKTYEQEHDTTCPIRFNIETKFRNDWCRADVEEMTRILVNTIEAAEMEKRSTIQSFVLDVLPMVKNLNQHIALSALFQPDILIKTLLKLNLGTGREKIIWQAIAADADIISPHYLYVNQKFIRKCHDNGKKVLPWVVNDEAKIKKFLNYGVDGIISDYPDRLYRVYSEWSKLET